MQNCPSGSTTLYMDRVNDKKEESRNWGFFETGFNCKVIFKAINMNGKMHVEVQNVDNTKLVIYEMPENYDKNVIKSTGIVENNRMYSGNGVYFVPTDWSLWLVYSPKFGGGNIKFKYWVEDYTSEDVGRINGEWQPTGTSYVDEAALAAERK